jgi:hypothetical protein
VKEFGNLAKAGNTLVVPANLSDVASMVALAMKVARKEDVLPTAAAPRPPVPRPPGGAAPPGMPRPPGA